MLLPHRLRALVVSFSAVGLLLTARSADAGCTVECTSIKHEGVTITPELTCLVKVGAPDDNACVCASEQRLQNNCGSALQVKTRLNDTSCLSNCGDRTVAPGDTFGVEVRGARNVPREGSGYRERVTQEFIVTVDGDARKTEHVVVVAASTEIDPEASACSASPRRPRRGRESGALAIVVGAGVAAMARFGRRRPRG